MNLPQFSNFFFTSIDPRKLIPYFEFCG
jgi:hypothetical protein